MAHSEVFLPIILKTFKHDLLSPVWRPHLSPHSSFATQSPMNCTYEKKVKHRMLYLLLAIEPQPSGSPVNTSHAVLHFLFFFSVAGTPSEIQKWSHCCVPLFLACALPFTHEHLGVVPCALCVQFGFKCGSWGCVPTKPILCLVPRVNVVSCDGCVSCDGRVSAPSPYVHVNLAYVWTCYLHHIYRTDLIIILLNIMHCSFYTLF